MEAHSGEIRRGDYQPYLGRKARKAQSGLRRTWAKSRQRHLAKWSVCSFSEFMLRLSLSASTEAT